MTALPKVERGKPFQIPLPDEETIWGTLLLNEWKAITTRTSRRLIDEIRFEGGIPILPPKFFPLIGTIYSLLEVARSTIPEGQTMIPFQIFVCYYRNGEDSCPMHSHPCRQLTLSLGAPRKMRVGSKDILLGHRSCIFLHGEKHGIPKVRGEETGDRISLNLFFTTDREGQGAQ